MQDDTNKGRSFVTPAPRCVNTDTTTTAAPDVEALLSTVETAGAALIAALEACVAAGIPAEKFWIADAGRAVRVGDARAWLTEQARPKGPMVTITTPGQYGSADRTHQAEVEKITEASIIVRGGDAYRIDNGWRRHNPRYGRAPRIAPEEIARIVALGWTPPKPAKKATKK